MTTTVRELKTDVFAAMRQGVILDRTDALFFEAFDAAIDAYVSSCALSPAVIPTTRTRRAWLNEMSRMIHRSAVLSPAH